MGFEFQSHHPVMQEGQLVGYRLTPYITVAIGGDNKAIAVTVQAGRFWGSGGEEIPIDELPESVVTAIDNWSDAARQSVGLGPRKPTPAKKVG